MIILDALFPSWQRDADQLLDDLLGRILAGDVHGAASLFAADSVLETPFAPTGHPHRFVGQDAVAERFARWHTRYRTCELVAERRHFGAPRTVVWELDLETQDPSDAPHRLKHVVVLDITDGRIVAFRDYNGRIALEGGGGTLG